MNGWSNDARIFFSLMVCSICRFLTISDLVRAFMAKNCLPLISLTRWTRPKEPVPRVRKTVKSVRLGFFASDGRGSSGSAPGFTSARLTVDRTGFSVDIYKSLFTLQASFFEGSLYLFIERKGRTSPIVSSEINEGDGRPDKEMVQNGDLRQCKYL